MEYPVKVDGVEYWQAVATIDGDSACALLGPNLQEGEAEFVTVGTLPPSHAMFIAVQKLAQRLKLHSLPYIEAGVCAHDPEDILPSIY